MDVLNLIYLILGIATSLITIFTAIFGVLKLVNNYTQSKQQNKSELYIPNHIKQPKKQKIKRTWVIFILVLSITLIGSSIILFSLAFKSTRTPPTSSTATAQAKLTTTVQSTASPSASPTTTNLANTTATVPAIATLDASLTNPYPPHQGKLALNTPFTTSDSKWDGSANCQLTNEAYSVTTLYGFTECLEKVDSYSNFVYQVQMKFMTKNTCGGILFRDQSNPYIAEYYEFYICTDDTYQFGEVFGGFCSIVNGSSLFNTGVGQANVIAIVARGTQFELYINGQMVNKGSDSSYSMGRIGVFAYFLTDLHTSQKVAFNDVKVWIL